MKFKIGDIVQGIKSQNIYKILVLYKESGVGLCLKSNSPFYKEGGEILLGDIENSFEILNEKLNNHPYTDIFK